jgi:hypothetical protein
LNDWSNRIDIEVLPNVPGKLHQLKSPLLSRNQSLELLELARDWNECFPASFLYFQGSSALKDILGFQLIW